MCFISYSMWSNKLCWMLNDSGDSVMPGSTYWSYFLFCWTWKKMLNAIHSTPSLYLLPIKVTWFIVYISWKCVIMNSLNCVCNTVTIHFIFLCFLFIFKVNCSIFWVLLGTSWKYRHWRCDWVWDTEAGSQALSKYDCKTLTHLSKRYCFSKLKNARGSPTKCWTPRELEFSQVSVFSFLCWAGIPPTLTFGQNHFCSGHWSITTNTDCCIA
jgi:hypothetical protein